MEHPSTRALHFSSAQQHCVSCCAAAHLTPVPSGSYCSILYFDIAAFGDPIRDNDIQMFARWGLYRILQKAFERTGIPWDACYDEDRGDGVLSIVPPTIPTDTVVGLPVWLQAEIRRYNKCASSAARIQLRAALHVGPVYRDEHGISGQSLVHAARLLDAQPAKDALATSEADLVFTVSDSVYDSVIQHSPQLVDATVYRRIQTQVKETIVTAWMTVSGRCDQPSPLDQQSLLASIPELT